MRIIHLQQNLSKKISREFATFAAVGAIATSIHFAFLLLSVQFYRFNPLLASCYGYLLGTFTSYFLNRIYTFKSKKNYYTAAIQFLCVCSVGFLLNEMLMALGIHLLGLPYLIAQVIATGFVLCWNFTAHKEWTFKVAE